MVFERVRHMRMLIDKLLLTASLEQASRTLLKKYAFSLSLKSFTLRFTNFSVQNPILTATYRTKRVEAFTCVMLKGL